MTTYTDWTSGEPVEKEWTMTGPTDPALRALNFLPIPEQVLGNKDRQLGWAICRNQAMEAVSALAAAEAAPDWYDRDAAAFGRAHAAEAAPLDVAVREALALLVSVFDDVTDPEHWEIEQALKEARAALRSPDTETAGEAG